MKPLSSAPKRRVQVVACFVLGLASGVQAQVGANSTQANEPARQATPPVSASEAPTPSFDVLEFVVEGNTVLSDAAIEKAVTPFLGEGKTFASVEGARAALEKAYQDAGYLTVFVDLPEQEVSQGLITLKVQEGRVERLAVSGARYYSQGYIRARVPELAEGKVPNFNVVQAQLADVNRTDDRRVQPVLRPGRTPNSAEVELKVTDQVPVHAMVELDNNHTQFNKTWRAVGSVRYDNLFQQDHSLQMVAITNPQNPSQSKAFGLNYVIPQSGGDGWQAVALWSDSQLEAFSSVSILGRGQIVGIKRQWGLPINGGLTHALTFGADYKNMKERVVVGSDQVASPIRYMPFTLGHNGSWTQEDGAVTTFNNNFVFGVASLFQHDVDCGFGPQDQFACKRDGADGGFAYFRADWRHSQPIGKWNLGLRLGGQVATQPVVGVEQYAIGGADSVRGYLAVEAVGDHGVTASVQLNTPNLSPATKLTEGEESLWRSLDEFNAYAFIDAGQVSVIRASVGEASHQTLAAVGVGFKLKANKAWVLNTDVARAVRAGSATRVNDKRVHVRLSADF